MGLCWCLLVLLTSSELVQAIKAKSSGLHPEHAAAGKAAVKKPGSVGVDNSLTQVLAMDCEMVGVGPNGSKSVLARVCIVNAAGNKLIDAFVQPMEKVTDYRSVG
jgi:RNA exonuclease 4